MSLRADLARRVQRLNAPTDVSIVSDDCWGGQFYRSLHLPYLTPTVGCWIDPAEYLTFVRHFADGDALLPLRVTVEKDYPVLHTKHARLHFIHDQDPRKVAETFERRVSRLCFDRLHVKIDFGRRGYTPEAVREWNALALPRSVALYPAGFCRGGDAAIHHGVEVADWDADAAVNFYRSRRSFDLLTWLNSDRIAKSAWKQPLYTLFVDPSWKKTLRDKFRGRSRPGLVRS